MVPSPCTLKYIISWMYPIEDEFIASFHKGTIHKQRPHKSWVCKHLFYHLHHHLISSTISIATYHLIYHFLLQHILFIQNLYFCQNQIYDIQIRMVFLHKNQHPQIFTQCCSTKTNRAQTHDAIKSIYEKIACLHEDMRILKHGGMLGLKYSHVFTIQYHHS